MSLVALAPVGQHPSPFTQLIYVDPVAVHAAVHPVETLFVVDAMLGQDAVNTAKAVFHPCLQRTRHLAAALFAEGPVFRFLTVAGLNRIHGAKYDGTGQAGQDRELAIRHNKDDLVAGVSQIRRAAACSA